MRKLVLDGRGIPTGDEEPFGGFNAELGESSFDDGFALMEERTSLSVAGATCRVSVDLLAGYRYAQVFAPKDKNYIALEPMTAPTSALTSGRAVENKVKKFSLGERLGNCCERGGFTGAGKGLNLQRRAHIQITHGLANSVLFVGKIH